MGARPEMSEEPYVRAIARTMARSKYPLAWFEGYPSELFEKIKQLREEVLANGLVSDSQTLQQ